MRFYVDVDLHVPGALEEVTWDVLEKIIIEESRRFFPTLAENDATFEAMVLASGTRDVSMPDGSAGTKAGIHVVFQNMFVDVDMALYISSAIIARVEKTWPDAASGLASCIDQAVYGKTRGLRWAWQFKCKTCHRCSSTSDEGRVIPNRKGCTHCYNGVLADVSSSMYAPVHIVDGSGRRTVLPDCRDAPTVELLLAASIRHADVEVVSRGFSVYEGAPPRPMLRPIGKKSENCVAVITNAGEPVKSAKAEMLLRGSPMANALQAAVRRVHRMYADIDVKYAHKAANGNWYKVFVRNSGASYCLNVQKDHSHAQILFLAKRSGVQQICQCKCDTIEGRASGKRCRDYQSALHQLLSSERDILFPPEKGSAGVEDAFLSSTSSLMGFRKPSTMEETAVVYQSEKQLRSVAIPLPSSAACFTDSEREMRTSELFSVKRKFSFFTKK